MTQQQRILEYLEQGNTITTLNAFNELGITRLASRIYDLKASGVAIQRKMMCPGGQGVHAKSIAHGWHGVHGGCKSFLLHNYASVCND